MARLDSRLNRLETQRRADPADPHRDCLELFQARVIATAERPTDRTFYPQLSCFVGPDSECPHRAWVEDSFERDLHLHELASLDLTAEDLGEQGTPPTPEQLEQQARAVAAYRGRAAAELPRLEAKLDARLNPTSRANRSPTD
jgi:hypothetical protein